VLRDLKRIHSHICSVAYSALETAGESATSEVSEDERMRFALPGSNPGEQ
jgi:phosphate:Na+ symporter